MTLCLAMMKEGFNSQVQTLKEKLLKMSPGDGLSSNQINTASERESDHHNSKLQNEVLKQFSPLANAVISHAAKSLSTSLDDLHDGFEKSYSGSAKAPLEYARTFLEHCCFKALDRLTQNDDYLKNAEFRHFTYDFMLAWGEPFEDKRDMEDKKEKAKEGEGEEEADEDASIFFSDLMPIVAKVEKAVQGDAFVRIAPCMSILADAITVYPQFEILTAATSGRLPFPVLDKYVEGLEMSVQKMKNKNELSFLRNLPMSEEEHVLEVDGRPQLVIQHTGSKWKSGRLTLTDHALYFESTGILSYHDAIKYDLSTPIDHTVSTELSGPWGSRVFDKAISYTTSSPETHTVFGFPQVSGASRRDYWLALIQEVIDTHKVITKYQLEGMYKRELLARSALGILRLQATGRCMQLILSSPGSLLTFNLAQNLLRGGDSVLEALADCLKDAAANDDMELDASSVVQKSSTQVLESVKIWRPERTCKLVFYRIRPGEPTLLEETVKEARESSSFLHTAKQKEEEVKVDGIGLNITVLKGLLQPVSTIVSWIEDLFAWKRPVHNIGSFIIVSVLILRDWIEYIPPLLLTAAGLHIIWLRISGKAVSRQEVVVQNPSGGISMDQFVSAQRAVSQLEGYLQAINIALLKVMAVVTSVNPKAAVYVPAVLFGIATVLVMVPIKYLLFALHVGLLAFSLRDKSTEAKPVRRLRELWHSIPPLPVRVVEPEPDKEKDD